MNSIMKVATKYLSRIYLCCSGPLAVYMPHSKPYIINTDILAKHIIDYDEMKAKNRLFL